MSQEFENALVKAKVAFLDNPKAAFISALCFHLPLYVNKSIPTLQTNGQKIEINPDFFMSLDPKLRPSAMAHEAVHVANHHMFRMGSRTDVERWQIATDHVVNLTLLEMGMPVGDDWYCDTQYKDMSADQVYDLLPPTPPAPPQGQGGSGKPSGGLGSDLSKDPGDGTQQPDNGSGDGQDKPKEGGTDLSPQEIQNKIDDMLVQAAAAATLAGQPGSIPASVQVYLDGLLKPKLPLNNLLRRFFTDLGKNDYTWSRPNKRFVPHHYLPKTKGGQLMHLAFAFDMSGSVSNHDTKRYVSELMNVLRMLQPDKLTLIQFDTEIKSVETIKSVNDMMKVKLVGRGGTSIHPLMDWAVKNKPNALIVFTDGEYSKPVVNPKCPILWLIHGHTKDRFHCDFGKTILFDTHD